MSEKKKTIGVLLAGLEACANWINMTYAPTKRLKVIVRKSQLSDWMKCLRLPSGCREHFPTPAKSNRFEEHKVREWIEKYLLKPENEITLDASGDVVYDEQKDWDNEGKKFRALQAELEFEDQKKARSDKYMITEEHHLSQERLVAAIRNETVAVEMDLPSALALLVREGQTGEELIIAFQKKCEDRFDRMARKFMELSKETDDVIQKEAAA